MIGANLTSSEKIQSNTLLITGEFIFISDGGFIGMRRTNWRTIQIGKNKKKLK